MASLPPVVRLLYIAITAEKKVINSILLVSAWFREWTHI